MLSRLPDAGCLSFPGCTTCFRKLSRCWEEGGRTWCCFEKLCWFTQANNPLRNAHHCQCLTWLRLKEGKVVLAPHVLVPFFWLYPFSGSLGDGRPLLCSGRPAEPEVWSLSCSGVSDFAKHRKPRLKYAQLSCKKLGDGWTLGQYRELLQPLGNSLCPSRGFGLNSDKTWALPGCFNCTGTAACIALPSDCIQ